jgi:prepilin-type N-terminal cleavage/methylation domain-containing protein
MSSNRAFTLLELLVVITIIGILSSIVIVSMSGSTDSATIAKGKAYAQQIHALLGHEAVLDLNFNENNYNTCPDGSDVCDASGYNNNGTISQDEDGAAFVLSPIDGYALSFDGVDDYVPFPSLDYLPSLTVSAWFKLPVYPPVASQAIIGGGPLASYLYIHANGSLMYWIATEPRRGGYFTQSLIGIVSANTWHHVVFIIDLALLPSNNVTAYIDGTSLGTNYKYDFPDVNAFSHIGAYGVVTAPWLGEIDEVRIYAAALPTTEIQKHYVQGLEKLLSNQAITQSEYDQRMEEFDQSLVLYE